MFFPHSGGAWGSSGIPRRRPEKIAYCARQNVHNLIYAGQKEVVFWTGVVEVRVIHTYSPFVLLLWDNHHVGQPFRVLNYSDKSVMQKIIDLGPDDQVAIWMKAPHFLSDRLGGWGDV